MWKNKLEKFDFKMDEIRLFDAFAGKGALHKSLKKLGIPLKVVGLSEVEPDAIIAYAGVHIENFKDLDFDFPPDEKMRKLLMDRNIGWDFIKQKSSIPRMKKEKVKLLYKATILTNNLGDISKLDYDNMFDFDLFNLSFCCQDISNAGKQKGLKNEDGTHTRSGLIKFGLDVVKAKKPKYIMIENVKALIQKKFINDFYSIINEIESYGYKCFYPTKEDKKGNIIPTCLNAKDYGIPQNRERIFVICIRNDINLEFEFPKGFDMGIRLKDLLEDNVDEKYYLSEKIQSNFKLNMTNSFKANCNLNKQDEVAQQNLFTNADTTVVASRGRYNADGKVEQNFEINNTGNCNTLTTVQKDNYILESKVLRLGGLFDKRDKTHQAGSVYSELGLSPTMDTKNRSKWLDFENFKIRKLTPLECWRLMGFDDEDFYRTKELGLSDSSLYKLAGNSIVVNCLYYIFKEVFKQHMVEK